MFLRFFVGFGEYKNSRIEFLPADRLSSPKDKQYATTGFCPWLSCRCPGENFLH